LVSGPVATIVTGSSLVSTTSWLSRGAPRGNSRKRYPVGLPSDSRRCMIRQNGRRADAPGAGSARRGVAALARDLA